MAKDATKISYRAWRKEIDTAYRNEMRELFPIFLADRLTAGVRKSRTLTGSNAFIRATTLSQRYEALRRTRPMPFYGDLPLQLLLISGAVAVLAVGQLAVHYISKIKL